MRASFRAFMHKLIDYAGLFPPARLPMEPAIRNYTVYRQGTDAWMISRFICPAARLEELSGEEKYFPPDEVLPLTILPRGGETMEQFLENLEQDRDDMQAFLRRHPGRVAIEVLETRLPQALLLQDNSEAISDFFTEMLQLIRPENEMSFFFEAVLSESRHRELEQSIERIAAMNREVGTVFPEASLIGFKLRCGGEEAAAFPEPGQLAFAIDCCRRHDVPFKATAGLHHPVRHFNRGVQTKMHGFFNVFGAALLAWANELPLTVIEQIVSDETAGNFRFTDRDFSWNDFRVSSEQIESLRRERVISFGSCDFDEPRNDLRALGFFD